MYLNDSFSIDVYSQKDLDRINNNGVISSSIVFRNDTIATIKELKLIQGSLGISECSIQSLGSLERIKGDFWMSNQLITNSLESLGQLVEVHGNCSLRFSMVESLSNLEHVGGTLNLRDTPIQDLGNLKTVGGNLLLPKESKNRLNLDDLKVKGKISFWKTVKDHKSIENEIVENFIYHDVEVVDWPHQYIFSLNDLHQANREQQLFYKDFKNAFNNNVHYNLKGNYNYAFVLMFDLIGFFKSNSNSHTFFDTMLRVANYYPRLGPYIFPDLILKYKLIGEFDKSWQLIKKTNKIDLFNYFEFQVHLNKSLFEDVGIMFFAENWVLTEFGRSHVEEIIQIANKTVLEREKVQLEKFTDSFFNDDIIINDIIDKRLDLEFKDDLNVDYYSVFFEYPEEFEIAKGKHFNMRKFTGFPVIILESIKSCANQILRNSENEFRKLKGIPQIGEGWINETRLFYQISEYFVGYKIIQHASPSWLGRQHLDIYFPDENIGIEYQGIQHYEPVEFFGGIVGYEKTKERDNRKKLLCIENNCKLFHVDEGYVLEEVIKCIEKILKEARTDKESG
jgi:hypothetical protein